MSGTTSIVISGLLRGFGQSIMRLWTSDQLIVEEAQRANMGMVFCVPPYSVMMTLLGALRGANLQTSGAVAVGVSFYVVGLPLGALMGLRTHLGLLGVFLGNVIGLSLSSLIMGVTVCCVNWDKVVQASSRESFFQTIVGLKK